MKSSLTCIFMAIALSTSYTLPILAEIPRQNTYTAKNCLETFESDSPECSRKIYQKSASMGSSSLIAKSAAVVVRIPDNISMDIANFNSYPRMVPLAFSILDNRGNVAIPANTPIAIKLVKSQGGLKIVADSILMNGKNIAVEASSDVIPGQIRTMTSGTEQAGQITPTWSRLGGALGAIFGGGVGGMLIGSAVGNIAGVVVGMNSAETAHIVNIPANSHYNLRLTKAINLAPAIATSEPSPSTFSQSH